MLSAIGTFLGRKANKATTPTVRPPFPTSAPAPSSSRRRDDPRDIYARVFRWRPCAKFPEAPTSVEIVGSFTRWQTVSLTHDPVQNTWAVTIQGIPGKRTHHYMLL